jgi:FAD/FMN-containing dehydrogenase
VTPADVGEGVARELVEIVGAPHVLSDPEVRAGFETDWTGRYSGRASCVVRPGSTAEVAAVLRTCASAGVAVVPQGGNTGLVGASVPRGGEVVLSTRRLDDLEPVDARYGEVVVGAGATLEAVRRAAHDSGWDVGVDLASRESATVGGMVATNAGGEHVVRYGRMRQQVLGIEAVLADGSIVGRVPALRKDATGIEWAGVLSGSEGTLAVVTRVHLTLVRVLPDHVVALVGVDDFPAAVRLADELRLRLSSLLALEVMFADGIRRVRAHAALPAPFAVECPVCVLVEVASDAGSDHEAEQLAGVLDRQVVVRASAVAIDGPARARLWQYRDLQTEALNLAVPHKLDVTLPHDSIVEFVARVGPEIATLAPAAEVVLFGHLGDGNLHVNVLGLAPDDSAVDHAVLELVASLGGSISAEHGIGVAKRRELPLCRSVADIEAMRAVKRALDPRGVLNPGVLLPDPAAVAVQAWQ